MTDARPNPDAITRAEATEAALAAAVKERDHWESSARRTMSNLNEAQLRRAAAVKDADRLRTKVDAVEATLTFMEAGMEARPDAELRPAEQSARQGQRAVIRLTRDALARAALEAEDGE